METIDPNARIPDEVKSLHPIVLEIGLGVTGEQPCTIQEDAISAAREVLLALEGSEELRHAARSLIACAQMLELQQGSPFAAAQIISLLHEPEVLEAIKGLEEVDATAKAFGKFADRAEMKKPPKLGDERPDDTLSIQQLGVRRFL